MQSAQALRSRDASIATAVLAASIAAGLALSPTARAQTPYLVDDIVPAPGASSFPAEFTACQGLAFFRAYEPATGIELWKSDGTAAGTTLVHEINVGPDGSNVSNLTAVGSALFFCASEFATGLELWITDGTSAGTRLVKDIVAGSTSSAPASLTAAGGLLFFTVDDGTHGTELWKSDGTDAGTTLVHDIAPGPEGSTPTHLTLMNGLLYFAASEPASGRELWLSTGMANGTFLFKDIVPGPSSSFPANLIDVAGQLFFNATDGTNGSELWKSDGTPLGTTLVEDIYPGPGSSGSGTRVVLNGILYFAANEPATGLELWRSDGTRAGTWLVKDVQLGPTGSTLQALCAVAGTLLFVANDGVNGFELWRSDGTDAGTQMLADVFPGPESGFVEDVIFPDVEPLCVIHSRALFRAQEGTSGYELWQSDGTAAGTSRVADIRPGPEGSSPRELTPIGSTVFFHADDGLAGREPWAIEAPQGSPFCFGDGSEPGVIACPCANTGAPGHGCAHSQAASGALLSALGSAQPDEVVLYADGLVPTVLAIFLQGDLDIAGGVPFGDGIRCAGGFLLRLGFKNATGGSASYPEASDLSISARSAQLGDPITPGTTRYYQTYFRDPNLGYCPNPPGNSWNISNALAIDW